MYVDNLGVLGTSRVKVDEDLMMAIQTLKSRSLDTHEEIVHSDTDTALGIHNDMRNMLVGVAPMRLWRLKQGLRRALRCRALPRKTWEVLLGHMTFVALLRRTKHPQTIWIREVPHPPGDGRRPLAHHRQHSQITGSKTRNGESGRRHLEVPEREIPTKKRQNPRVNGCMDEVRKLALRIVHSHHSENTANQTCTRKIASNLAPSEGGGRGAYKTVNGDVPFSITTARAALTDTTT